MKNKNTKFGFVTLTTVIIVGVIATTAAVSMLFVGTNATKTNQTMIDMNQGKSIANACAEVALNLIQQNINYSGTNNVSLGDGNCSYTVVVLTGQNRSITVTSTDGTVNRKDTISITQVMPQIIIGSWQEN